jgi:hypothetical protein
MTPLCAEVAAVVGKVAAWPPIEQRFTSASASTKWSTWKVNLPATPTYPAQRLLVKAGSVEHRVPRGVCANAAAENRRAVRTARKFIVRSARDIVAIDES